MKYFTVIKKVAEKTLQLFYFQATQIEKQLSAK